MRSRLHCDNHQQHIAPIKFVRGGENLDIANSILRTEMKSTKNKKSHSHSRKSSVNRSSQRRSASIERIFEKKKVDVEKKEIDILQKQFNQIKKQEEQNAKVNNSSNKCVSNTELKPSNNPKTTHKSHSAPIESQKQNSIQLKQVHRNTVIKPSRPDIEAITARNKIDHSFKSSLKRNESKECINQSLSRTMTTRRANFTPIFDSDSDSSSDM
ncbi:hypothetical protein GPJ56_002833 [Histomonas meleagridis]|uniref:uncharacterized protein n=1 Tax=Histomonas meleagridis TaxID=135588 RepID=UPI0035599887|nr:hypothetical protein GPJ56_002833 [Histomonas meleagridis]KAH0806349.1 hypothetical protein GO595_001037 [Histomonas meleagridis]